MFLFKKNLEYIYKNFGNFYETDLELLEKQINNPCDLMEPFVNFIKRIEDIIDIVEATGCAYVTIKIIYKA